MNGASVAVSSLPLTSVLRSTFDSSQIEKKDLNLKSKSGDVKFAFLLYNVFGSEECDDLIKLSEDCGYTESLLNIGDRQDVLIESFKGNSRLLLIDDQEFVKSLLHRISSYIPGLKLFGINERLRFSRYESGDKFRPHNDDSYCRPDNSTATLITLQIYLNQNFVGGETSFLDMCDNTECVPVKPITGMVLVMDHRISHEESVVNSGRKYTIRTDVLYTSENPTTILNQLSCRVDEDGYDEGQACCGCQCL